MKQRSVGGPRRSGRKWSSNARKTEEDGHVFDSGAEHRRYCELKLLARSGEIQDLRVHTKHELRINGRPILIKSEGYPKGRKMTWTDDFSYRVFDPENPSHPKLVVEDVKGYDTYQMRIKRGVFEAITGIEVQVIING